MDDTYARLTRIDEYIEALFVRPDPTLDENLRDAEAAGLPPINVSANEGQLIGLIVRMTKARRVLEIGTLGGYSTTWLARGLAPGGTIVSLEVDPRHAEVARANLARSVPGAAVEIRVGPAAAAMAAMIAAGEPPFDVIFIDADKPAYEEYLTLGLRLSRPGTVILADNVIRDGLVIDPAPADANARAARAFNAALAAHPRLVSTIVPIARRNIDGLSISIVTS